ncbi:MAG: hypothetical protein KGK01_01720 [Bradyrhizobium sp.]|uniref:hypothetical protein n=1 Tax=Bradyrhizobium sp. TaxID=376 RepID=UPI001C28CB70|nr:hypothetical protein [Bradyrhizobium sp.]MBU6463177.1 hypothetical protein [Pseudomonadota bacterium]MDE2066983.1 hypothetical protein [Bradyrhizobium sp.]MDE2241184.1 hypothetical protein [Bradyrhizobium sp.]MDE2473084.1 hypothetical protein [Bradyrhizobium sp.]
MSHRPDWERQREFLLRLYFGEADVKDGFTGRAYRDFNRTLHGLGQHVEKERMKELAAESIRTSLAELAAMVPHTSENLREAFDYWHSSACSCIVRCFAQFGAFNYGQAQKWLNMTIKYRWFFSESDPLNEWFKAAHVPVDDYVLRAAEDAGISSPVRLPWSRWDASAYLSFQNRVREHAA